MPFRFAAGQTSDGVDTAPVTRTAQTERPAVLIGAASAANAVDVDLWIGRDVDIDHRFEPVDVQTTRGDVGRDQYRAATIGELDQHLIAFALLQVAIQRQRVKTVGLQGSKQIAALLFGVAEGQCTDRPVVLEQRGDSLQAFFMFDLVKTLADFAVLVLFQQFDFLRIAQKLVRQLSDTLRVGGRKEHGLAADRAMFGDDHDVIVETHVEHAVGLVEHQCIECVKTQATAFKVIHEAPRRADDDVRTVFETVPLRADRGAAAQG